MLLRFVDVPKDAVTVAETGFLDRPSAPRVTELIGRVASVEATMKKTATKAMQAALQGQSRALLGAIVFSEKEPRDEALMKRLAERWEADFLPDYARSEHYEIIWQHLDWGAGHELRFLLPLWNKAEQAPLVVSKIAQERKDLWVRVQALTFELEDPLPKHRAGIRPAFVLADKGPNKGLRLSLQAYVEEAVMAGELRSRGDVIADLGKLQFEVMKAEPHALTVKYVGDDAELLAKSKRPLTLTGPVFGDGFGLVDDPKVVRIEQAAREASERLKREAKAQLDGLSPSISEAVEKALDEKAGAAVQATDKALAEIRAKHEKALEASLEAHRSEIEIGLAKTSKAAQGARQEVSGLLADYKKVATETKEQLVKDAQRDLTDSVEVVKVFRRDLDAAKQQLDDLVVKKDAQIRKLTFGLIGASVVAVLLLVPTVYIAAGGAGMVAKVHAASSQIEADQARMSALAAQTEDELVQHRAALSHAVELQGQVQASMQGFAQSLSFLGDAVRIEEKADGSQAVTIYTRRIPTVRNCDRDPGCVARVDTRSN